MEGTEGYEYIRKYFRTYGTLQWKLSWSTVNLLTHCLLTAFSQGVFVTSFAVARDSLPKANIGPIGASIAHIIYGSTYVSPTSIAHKRIYSSSRRSVVINYRIDDGLYLAREQQLYSTVRYR